MSFDNYIQVYWGKYNCIEINRYVIELFNWIEQER